MDNTAKKKKYMLEALELAARGFGAVEPNPMVGCVIFKDDKVIGRGWHKQFGGAHAEINALADCCRGHSFDSHGASMCVTLEPCCHQGKTAPCTEAIIAAGISRVYIAMIDPSDKVAGKGIEQLKSAGVEVRVGLCEKLAEKLNPAFIKYSKTHRPWVILKWAQTIDGKLDGARPEHKCISGEMSRKDVHKTRRSCQAILVGINTVVADDPLLTARPDKGKKLLRVVLDNELEIPVESQLLNTVEQGDVLIVTTEDAFRAKQQKVEQIVNKGAKIFTAKSDSAGFCDLDDVLLELGRRGVQRLLVEGGREVIGAFLKNDLADELNIYIAPKIYGSKGRIDISDTLAGIDLADEFLDVQTGLFDNDVKIRAILKKY